MSNTQPMPCIQVILIRVTIIIQEMLLDVTVIKNENSLVGLEFSFERVVRLGTERNKCF